jgi:hypothetical protein
MYLGIDVQTGLAFDGLGAAEFPCLPQPAISFAKLVQEGGRDQDLPSGLAGHCDGWVFREDSFDPITRVRRGRLYQTMAGMSYPSPQRVAPHPFEDPSGRAVGPMGRTMKELNVYVACSQLLSEPRQGLGAKIVLGSRRASTAWRVIQTEVLVSGCVMVALKALTSFGVLPELDVSKIDAQFLTPVRQAVDRVLDSAFRETPISVIDHCRNAMTAVLAHWMAQQGHDRSILSKDLAKVADEVGQSPHDQTCASHLGRVIARLHVRGKGNEQGTRNLRIPVEEDAETAIHALGFAMREIGWACP